MRRFLSAFAADHDTAVIKPSALPPKEISRLIETVSLSIENPLLKLKFIHAALDRYAHTCRVMVVPSLDAKLTKQVLLEALDLLVPGHRIIIADPETALAAEKPLRRIRAPRLSQMTVLIGLVLVMSTTYWVQARLGIKAHNAAVPIYRWATEGLERKSESTPHSSISAKLESPADWGVRSAKAADSSPQATYDAASLPEIWMVEEKSGYEFYSNGLNISTEFAVAGRPRRYRTFDRADGALSEIKERPAGLLYHTSEGDVAPFERRFNRLLNRRTRELLQYIKQDHLYHYVIDRFGRVYRVVNETEVAHHAGFSIWSDESDVFLLLNQSFIGICFEGRWSESLNSDPPDGASTSATLRVITRAQLEAGRLLTDWLRQKYHISDSNCVTHGLTSVNPQKFLIGHHLDWAKDFPFRDLGLSDKYQKPLPSITEFGFAYDDFFLQVMGRPWPGINLAMGQLQARADRDKISYETLRRKLNRRFAHQLAQLRGETEGDKDFGRADLSQLTNALDGQP
ncbi:MAG: N-acetylmuramoyl-L-alanine amidase [Acidobacteria bacterium]|nr:N-acetylmuramoyl-L-alanine amidase [Acidobacteriota bacterium]MBI3656397.1 N-acetylmuramoyl-L-alanine amidase [Acidobacteriota bacterium]